LLDIGYDIMIFLPPSVRRRLSEISDSLISTTLVKSPKAQIVSNSKSND